MCLDLMKSFITFSSKHFLALFGYNTTSKQLVFLLYHYNCLLFALLNDITCFQLPDFSDTLRSC